jgi:hypothetical protein
LHFCRPAREFVEHGQFADPYVAARKAVGIGQIAAR